MLAEELHAYHKSSRFNFRNEDVQILQDQINSIVILNYAFPRTEYLQRLDEAVHMLGNFLIRPQWTLASVLFEHENTISSPALARLLRHFGPYEYLRNLITHYIHEKKVESFGRTDFSRLISRMDGEYIRRKAGDELARVMSPMYDFFDYPVNNGTNRLPVKALIRYFEDKGLNTVISRLEGEVSQGRQELALRELGGLLEDVRRTSGAFEVEQWDPGHSSAPDLPGGGRTPTGSAEAKGHPAAKGLPIMDSIAEGDRRRFIKKIFNQDETSFAAAVDTIGTMRSWKEASKFIDQILIRNDVDPYSTEAERFVAIISRQFQPKR
jgi:hypothetical protein